MRPIKPTAMNRKGNSDLAMNISEQNEPMLMVSYFPNLKVKECSPINILDVFQYLRQGKYKKQIDEIRSETNSDKIRLLKEMLPAITVSGTFNNSHSAKDIIQHSGLIQIDLDHVDTFNVKKYLIMDQFTYACFLSPTGTGVKVIVKIDPDSHEASFIGLKRYYRTTYNLEIDPKCKDVGRAMFLSYDENLYFNQDSLIFPTEIQTSVASNKGSKRIKGVSTENSLNEGKFDNVGLLIAQVEENRLDITSGYDNWLKIGFALSNSFGEKGRIYFHRLSIFNQDYSVSETDSQYDKCLHSKNEGVTLGTLYFIAKSYGITLSKIILSKSEKINGLNISDTYETSTCEKVEHLLSNQYKFRCNEINGDIEYKLIGDVFYMPLNEDNIHRFIQHNGIKFSFANLISLLRSDYVPKYNPFLDYFEGLPKWNKVSDPDFISQLASKVIAKDQIRFFKQFKKMLVRVVACALNDKVFNKHAFIFVHDQQKSGKSTFCRFLCPPTLQNYISESFAMDKDSLISLSENIFINLDELSTLSKIEINTLKSMFTKDKVKVRKPYEKKATNSPRRCSFIGSTNKSEFLSDETGSVRWLCFEIEGIDFSYSKEINIDSVWSQAYSLYMAEFEYQLTIDELRENEIANEKHFQVSFEHDLILKYFIPSDRNNFDAEFKTATELASILNEKFPELKLRLSNSMMGKALKSLGFRQDQAFNGKYQRKGYYVITTKDEK